MSIQDRAVHAKNNMKKIVPKKSTFKANPEGDKKLPVDLSKKEEFLSWWSQGLSLGLIKYDGEVLEGPESSRFANWWAHGLSLGIVKVDDKDVKVEKGRNITDHLARIFTLGIVSDSEGTATTVDEKTNDDKGLF